MRPKCHVILFSLHILKLFQLCIAIPIDGWGWVASLGGQEGARSQLLQMLPIREMFDYDLISSVTNVPNEVLGIGILHSHTIIQGRRARTDVRISFEHSGQQAQSVSFPMRLGEKSWIEGFRIYDHSGRKSTAQRMTSTQARDRFSEFALRGEDAVALIQTSPETKEYEIYVTMKTTSAMNFHMNHQEQLQPFYSSIYEHITSIYPKGEVKEYKMEVVILHSSRAEISEVSAYWDWYSATNMDINLNLLQNKVLVAEKFQEDNVRVILTPSSEDLQRPSSINSDFLVVITYVGLEDGFEESVVNFGSSVSSEMTFTTPVESTYSSDQDYVESSYSSDQDYAESSYSSDQEYTESSYASDQEYSGSEPFSSSGDTSFPSFESKSWFESSEGAGSASGDGSGDSMYESSTSDGPLISSSNEGIRTSSSVFYDSASDEDDIHFESDGDMTGNEVEIHHNVKGFKINFYQKETRMSVEFPSLQNHSSEEVTNNLYKRQLWTFLKRCFTTLFKTSSEEEK